MVSPEALKLNEILRNAPKAVDMDLTHQRAAGEHAEDMTSEPQGVTYEEAYAVDGLWATPESWDGEPAIMYLYGGGYVISSPHARDASWPDMSPARLELACSFPDTTSLLSAPSPLRSKTRRPTTGGCWKKGTGQCGSSSRGLERWRPDGRRDAQAA
jgi:hypothetical protein